MEVRILHRFHDKADFAKVYLVGETVIFDDARAAFLIGRGLAEAIEEPAVEAEESDAEVEEVIEEAEETQVEPEPAEIVETTDEAPVEEAIEEPQPEVRVKPVATKRKK